MKLHRQDYSRVGNKKDIFTLVTADQKKTKKKTAWPTFDDESWLELQTQEISRSLMWTGV